VKLIIYNEFCDELKQYWLSLEKTAQLHVFQSYSWVSYWQETIGQQILSVHPWIALVLDDSGVPRLIFPLSIRKSLGAKVLEFIGGEQGDYHGPIIDESFLCDDDLLELAWSKIKNELPAHDICYFKKLPAQWLVSENPIIKLFDVKPFQNSSFYTFLPDSFLEFRSRQRKKFKADSNRQRKRLAEIGVVEFKVFDGVSEICAKELNEMIEQKRHRCRVMNVPDLFASDVVQQFYKGLSDPFSLKNSRIHFSVLMLDDEVIASHWGAVHKDRFYYLIPTITIGSLRKYSPGRLLLEHLVEWSIDNNLKIFDFTIGGEEYKRDWCDNEMQLYEYFRVKTILGIPFYVFKTLLNKARSNERMWSGVKRLYSLLMYRK